jgi:hypothetical protein
MGVQLGKELTPANGAAAKPDATDEATLALLKEIHGTLKRLPMLIQQAVAPGVQRAVAEAMRSMPTPSLPAPVVHVAAPDLSEITDAIADMVAPPSADEIGAAVAAATPARKTKRTVHRDSYGRIESTTEEEL